MLMNTHEARIEALRKELAGQGLDGFVIPISDEHMSEYVGGYAQRLAWLTGFGGSAGTAVVLKDKAAIFVDGRYTLQVREQVDGRRSRVRAGQIAQQLHARARREGRRCERVVRDVHLDVPTMSARRINGRPTFEGSDLHERLPNAIGDLSPMEQL